MKLLSIIGLWISCLIAGPLNRTLVEVGGQVITTRQVILSGVFDRWQLLHGHRDKMNSMNRNEWILKDGSENFEKQLSQLVLEHVVVLEAQSLSVAEVSPDQLKEWQNQLTSDFKNWPEWTAYQFSSEEIKSAIELKLQAQNFLRLKIKSSGVIPSDDEIKRYYRQNKFKFGGLPLEKFKDNIRDFLGQKALESRLKDWYDILKKKYQVRYLKSNQL